MNKEEVTKIDKTNKSDGGKRIAIRTFGWPYVPVRRDDIGVVEEDKWLGVKGLGKICF